MKVGNFFSNSEVGIPKTEVGKFNFHPSPLSWVFNFALPKIGISTALPCDVYRNLSIKPAAFLGDKFKILLQTNFNEEITERIPVKDRSEAL